MSPAALLLVEKRCCLGRTLYHLTLTCVEVIEVTIPLCGRDISHLYSYLISLYTILLLVVWLYVLVVPNLLGGVWRGKPAEVNRVLDLLGA